MDKCLALLVYNISDFDWNTNERKNNIIETYLRKILFCEKEKKYRD